MKENSKGTAYFLVHDINLKNAYCGNDSFFNWILEEGFTIHNLFSGTWMTVTALYVNINCKTIALGMPGIRLFEPIGCHAITVDEFKTIYEIYKKYEGKEPFVFN